MEEGATLEAGLLGEFARVLPVLTVRRNANGGGQGSEANHGGASDGGTRLRSTKAECRLEGPSRSFQPAPRATVLYECEVGQSLGPERIGEGRWRWRKAAEGGLQYSELLSPDMIDKQRCIVDRTARIMLRRGQDDRQQ